MPPQRLVHTFGYCQSEFKIPPADVRGHFLWCRVSGGSRTDGSTGRSRCMCDLLLQLVVVSS